MPNIRDISEIQRKFITVTPQRAGEYAAGVNNPKADWATETKKAEGAYKDGVTAAINRGAFGKGVSAAGTEAWKAGATKKGVDRFGPGVVASGDAYQKGFQPYHDVIKATSLPPRGATGSDSNYDRVKKMGQALHAKKISG